MIHFEKIRWKNFLSTGNQWTDIQLDRSPNTIIVGDNGAGKSTILDALTFVLFNKPFRKISKPQLLNTINERDLRVEIDFRIGKQKYKVIRGIKPAVFEIYNNDVLLNQPGSSRDYQKQLEETILKLNYKSFTQIVVLGASTFVPFMQLTAANRREVIEDLLDIRIFSSMGKLLKDKIAENKEDIRETEYQMEIIQTKIDAQKAYINKLKQQSDDTIATFQSMIDESNREIGVLTSNNEVMIEQTNKLMDEIADHDSVTSKSTKAFELINKLNEKHDKAHKRVSFFTDHNECPTCSQEIEDSIKSQKIDETNSIIKKVSKGIEDLENEYQSLQSRLAEISDKQLQITNFQKNVSTNHTTIKSLEKSIEKNSKEISKIKGASDDDTTAKDELVALQGNRKTFDTRKEELVHDRELYDVASDMLKDGGIKTRIIKQYVPVMNKLINKYLSALDFFVAFELDEEFNEVIKSRHRDEFSYASFSEGEKMRIDLALLFTWRAVAKMKNSANTNLLILDEVFDASLDVAGCDEFLKLIHQLGQGTNVFVISHKGDILSEKFRSQIKFEKYQNFSRIAETEA